MKLENKVFCLSVAELLHESLDDYYACYIHKRAGYPDGYLYELPIEEYNKLDNKLLYDDESLANAFVNYVFDNVGMSSSKALFLEQQIAKFATSSLRYALKTERPFVLGEEAISSNPVTSLKYAVSILNGRFHQGEEAISKDGQLSYKYATKVLNDVFPLGEPAIAKDSKLSYHYAKDVVKGRFFLW